MNDPSSTDKVRRVIDLSDIPLAPSCVRRWHSIDSAPRDGTLILACYTGPWAEWSAPFTAAFRPFHVNAPGKKQWRGPHGHPVHPTHWLPLDSLPSAPDRA